MSYEDALEVLNKNSANTTLKVRDIRRKSEVYLDMP